MKRARTRAGLIAELKTQDKAIQSLKTQLKIERFRSMNPEILMRYKSSCDITDTLTLISIDVVLKPKKLKFKKSTNFLNALVSVFFLAYKEKSLLPEFEFSCLCNKTNEMVKLSLEEIKTLEKA
ncbi:hypothetical protein [Algibacter sp. PT7-4]|uniref:hypothetical protein n=1 Tax=Algibacter ulvanivorans TaxID=3400999 RepID=UPI003AAD896E